MYEDIGIATIVTEAFLDEFAILKYSFELFHGTSYRWFVRCDRSSLPALSAHGNVSCVVFKERQPDRPAVYSDPFRAIVAEKMNVMDDAWSGVDQCRGVIFIDADIIFTAPLMPALRAMPGDVVLTPNHYPPPKQHLSPLHGEFNGGFAFTRSPAFASWWRDAYRDNPTRHNEQGCLDYAHEKFSVNRLGPEVNIGFWQSAAMLRYKPIPADCVFLHAHLYQPLTTQRDWIDKSFALHCMRFLAASTAPAHPQLFKRILSLDRYGWYDASLRLCGADDNQAKAADHEVLTLNP
jgi:hypothetical protein